MPELAAPYNYKANSNSKLLVWDLLVRNIYYVSVVGNDIIHCIFLWFHYLPTRCLSVRASAIIDTRCLIQVTASKAKNPSATNVPVDGNYHASPPRQKKENKWGGKYLIILISQKTWNNSLKLQVKPSLCFCLVSNVSEKTDYGFLEKNANKCIGLHTVYLVAPGHIIHNASIPPLW